MIPIGVILLLLCAIGERAVADARSMMAIALSKEQRNSLRGQAKLRRRIGAFLLLPYVGIFQFLGLFMPWGFRLSLLLGTACRALVDRAARAGIDWQETGTMVVQVVHFHVAPDPIRRTFLSNLLPELRRKHDKIRSATDSDR